MTRSEFVLQGAQLDQCLMFLRERNPLLGGVLTVIVTRLEMVEKAIEDEGDEDPDEGEDEEDDEEDGEEEDVHPSPELIARRAAEIRAGWSEAKRLKRLRPVWRPSPPWAVPLARVHEPQRCLPD